MSFGRESWVWWLGIASAVLAYLAAAEQPADWHYDDWIKAVGFVVATVSGKLSQPPLPRGDR